MKAIRLTIHNVGMISDEEIELDQPLILFYGDIRQGKTTILRAVQWCFGGAYPSDIIRHGESDAFVQLDIEEDGTPGSIRREWYKDKKEQVADRPITFIRNGQKVKKPFDAIRTMLNPFQLNQNHLVNMTELERKRYFSDLFHVDTTELDAELDQCLSDASELRATIKGYGEIALTPVDPVDVTSLQAARRVIVDAHTDTVEKSKINRDAAVASYRGEKENIETHNSLARARQDERKSAERQIERIDEEIAGLQMRRATAVQWIEGNPELPFRDEPCEPDTSEFDVILLSVPDTRDIDTQLSRADVQNVLHEQYLKDKQREEAKESDKRKLSDYEEKARDLRQSKVQKLKDVSDTCGIPGLSFDEQGDFCYEDTDAGMLSTSQLMRLSSELSALYPEGLGIELIDRGESLGRSIFEFVARAEEENKTILATIVGEKPAVIPERIGVYVVENGEVKHDAEVQP